MRRPNIVERVDVENVRGLADHGIKSQTIVKEGELPMKQERGHLRLPFMTVSGNEHLSAFTEDARIMVSHFAN